MEDDSTHRTFDIEKYGEKRTLITHMTGQETLPKEIKTDGQLTRVI